MSERIAVIDGVRTPFCKSGGALKQLCADDLGAIVVRELLNRVPLEPSAISELIFGNVLQPPHAFNIARVLAVKGGVPVDVPAFTVNRNCASGMEALTTARDHILLDPSLVIIAGGTESMSHFPLLFRSGMRDFLASFAKAKSFSAKAKACLAFRPSFLVPESPKIADPLCGLTMGQTAEILARDFTITREEQDRFALQSQQRSTAAQKAGKFAEEITPLFSPPDFSPQQQDDGIREESTIEGLRSLKPVFEKIAGTVTAGNASQVTDGAVSLLLMHESRAKEMGLEPLGYIGATACAALEPKRMGLGPAFAIAKLLEKVEKTLDAIDLIEINEAFAAQVIAVERALASVDFAKEKLGLSRAVGQIDPSKLNVNGGAIALGHPIGASGARLVLTLLKELRRSQKQCAIASLCVGGGQGEALYLEVN